MKRVINIFAFLSVVIFVACGKSQFSQKDPVLVDWYQNNWHMAELVKVCDKGWIVDFNDDFYNTKDADQPCYEISKIVKNIIPAASDVKVGDTLLAEWVPDAYYQAKVNKIDGKKYFVTFVNDGWESELTLEKLRILSSR